MVVIFILLLQWVGFDSKSTYQDTMRHCFNNTSMIAFYFNYCISTGRDPFSNQEISWRAFCLQAVNPIEYDLLAKKGLSLESPWDSEANVNARGYVPYFYRCGLNVNCEDSAIVAVRSDRGVFSDNISKDDSDDNLVFIEIANSGVNWLEPRDIDENELYAVTSNHVINGKDCIIIGMASGICYVLTLENFLQVYPALVDVASGKEITKKLDGRITTIVVR